MDKTDLDRRSQQGHMVEQPPYALSEKRMEWDDHDAAARQEATFKTTDHILVTRVDVPGVACVKAWNQAKKRRTIMHVRLTDEAKNSLNINKSLVRSPIPGSGIHVFQ